MNSIIKIIIMTCFSFFVFQCDQSPNEPDDNIMRELTAHEKKLVQADNRFGFNLFNEINDTQRDSNIFISPLSISMALGMTYNGAGGDTRDAMRSTLGLSGLTDQEINEAYQSLIELLTELDPRVKFNIANSIWYRDTMTFLEEFIRLNRTYLDAIVTALDFGDPSTIVTINDWVNDNTNGKIEKIINQIDGNTVMFLINAIYFKGTWQYEFDEDQTLSNIFYLPDGSQTNCQMMSQTADLQYFANDMFQAVDLPYGDGTFSMTVLLPAPDVNIDTLVGEFNQENWDIWLSSFSTQPVDLFFPKFTLEWEMKLNDVLSSLGMDIAFDPDRADFSKMYDGPGQLYISKVKHKTFVEVNEEGTEAAAVTSVEVALESVDPTNIIMRVDRPFLFVIREHSSGAILFMGKIVEPTT